MRELLHAAKFGWISMLRLEKPAEAGLQHGSRRTNVVVRVALLLKLNNTLTHTKSKTVYWFHPLNHVMVLNVSFHPSVSHALAAALARADRTRCKSAGPQSSLRGML